MRNEAKNIVKSAAEEMKERAQELQGKVRSAGTAAWEATKSTYRQVQDKTIAGARATDRTIRENPYAALGIALGVGVMIGLLLTRRNSRRTYEE